jgi:hypothetical protein
MSGVRVGSTALAFVACLAAAALSPASRERVAADDARGERDATVPGPNGGYPAGWLYVKDRTLFVSQGSAGTPWVGRGVNVDDIFLCGFNDTLYLPDPVGTEVTMLRTLVDDWRPNLLRLSLSMRSYATTASWLSDPGKYAEPVTAVVDALVASSGMHVLVTLRSDASMLVGNPADVDATYLPSDRDTTPDRERFPTGTDAVYVALVDTFARAGSVLFGLANEPGGMQKSDAVVAAAMGHAVGTIRAEEDRLGVPHHVIAVQGSRYSSDLRVYAQTPAPIRDDNVVYELHYYPSTGRQTPDDYSIADRLPLIVGEYGGFADDAAQRAFYEDMDARHLSSLAWDFEAFSDCAPDLVEVTRDATQVRATAWGSRVKDYLTSHGP